MQPGSKIEVRIGDEWFAATVIYGPNDDGRHGESFDYTLDDHPTMKSEYWLLANSDRWRWPEAAKVS